MRRLMIAGALMMLVGGTLVVCVLAVGGHFGVVSDWVRAALAAVIPRSAA